MPTPSTGENCLHPPIVMPIILSTYPQNHNSIKETENLVRRTQPDLKQWIAASEFLMCQIKKKISGISVFSVKQDTK